MSTTYRLFSRETKRNMLICSGRNGQQRVPCVSVLGGGMYVHSLNFKATFHVLRRRPRHCQYSTIVFANVLVAVTLSTYLHVDCRHFICFMSLFQDHVVCRNFILTGHQGRSDTQATKISSCHVQRIFNYLTVADLGEGPAPPPPPLIFRPKLKKIFFWRLGPPVISGPGWLGPRLSEGMDPSLLKRGGGGGEKEQLGSSRGL